MAHSLELLLDDHSEQAIRDQWSALTAAGLPSLVTNTSPTNRPHVTLLAARRISPSVDAALVPATQRLPISAIVGAPIVFGRGERRVLARLVVPSAELLSLHAQVSRVARDHLAHATGPVSTDGAFEHTTPGAWTPHVTLARRLTADQLSAALSVLDTGGDATTTGDIAARFVAMRRWDGDERVDHVWPGRAC
ncbi:2'-5' RNA ligase family protein [Gordonia soli]|uniref:2'-5' RNA ligase family protein n=1 Tax=Gordonia soli NBRC 108243 TaxID=1223545 RepID=M0QMP4_9ACTN|nr:2'-5' RNA ligase family protein [Gordonia soli]GAC69910.1 hypothetical protein GS4_29_00090 [Gordonia soli NBRC 108243]